MSCSSNIFEMAYDQRFTSGRPMTRSESSEKGIFGFLPYTSDVDAATTFTLYLDALASTLLVPWELINKVSSASLYRGILYAAR